MARTRSDKQTAAHNVQAKPPAGTQTDPPTFPGWPLKRGPAWRSQVGAGGNPVPVPPRSRPAPRSHSAAPRPRPNTCLSSSSSLRSHPALARPCTLPGPSAPPQRRPLPLRPLQLCSLPAPTPLPYPGAPGPCVLFCADALPCPSARSPLRRKPRLPARAPAGVPGGVFLCLCCSPPSLRGAPRPSLTREGAGSGRGSPGGGRRGAALRVRLFILSLRTRARSSCSLPSPLPPPPGAGAAGAAGARRALRLAASRARTRLCRAAERAGAGAVELVEAPGDRAQPEPCGELLAPAAQALTGVGSRGGSRPSAPPPPPSEPKFGISTPGESCTPPIMSLKGCGVGLVPPAPQL